MDGVLERYRDPSQLVQDKVIDHLDRHCRAFVELAPFATLSTASPDGWPDVSPRGGDPGFVKVLDQHRLALPDRPGNNRVDSLRNVAGNPRVALLFLVPGIEETLRVYGTAELAAPEDLGVDLTEFGRAPRSVLVVTVAWAYFQCAKSVMRSGLWDPARQVERSAFAPMREVFGDHCRLTTPLPDDAVMRAGLAEEL
ncbi:MSMEG_1061 family FMN-dependent PPOX-type flavoprotein [Geodermatophilus sp. CPCC 205761]|uniref:MSMEG_1061 family FMN-dependent PPOX-type flavoprotein n=1 Tax=Geodermatophilus sp. CPCC 205761 TaxID=2936597 RepID=UPI003EE92ED0